MGRPRSSFFPGHTRARARKRDVRTDPFLVKHFALFNSLASYAQGDATAPPLPPHKPRSAPNQAAKVAKSQARKAARLRQRYPVADVSTYTWPLPFPELPEYSRKPKSHLDELVEQEVKDTFDADYAMFRSQEWSSQHRLTREHLDQIIVDPKEVEESANAAKALVETVLSRFVTGVDKGKVGTTISSAKISAASEISLPMTSAVGAAQQAEHGTPVIAGAPLSDEPELDEEELDNEIWQDGRYSMKWKELLDYLQSTAGSSKTAQWKNWHMLNAIAKTRQRCDELFGREEQ